MTAARNVPWICGALALVAYVWLATPGPGWLDAQELGAAAVRLGVPHPTGFPLFTFAGRLFAWLPAGELAWRVHLGSAVAAALAVGLVARLVVALTREDLSGALAAVAAALVLASSMTFFRQATVTEVYASTAALLALSLYGLILIARGAGHAVGLAHAFVAGIAALGLHGSYRLLLFVPFAAVLARRWRKGARWPLAAPALAVLGAAAVTLYLPVRSGEVPELDWGHPSTAGALLDHVTARRIRVATFEQPMLSSEPAVVVALLRRVAASAEEDLGVLALLAAAGGAVALARRRGGRAPLALLAAIVVGDVAYAVWLNPMGIEDRQTGVPLALGLATLAGAGIAAGARTLGRFAPFGAAVLGVLCLVQPLAGGAPARLAARDSDAPRAWAEAALAQAPPDAVALLRSDSLSAALFWLTLAEPVRPDVAALVRQHLWDEARTRAVLGHAAGGEAEIIAGPRPVVWEITGGSEPRGPRYVPGIPLARVGEAAARHPAVEVDLARVFPAPSLEDPETREVARRALHDGGVLASRVGDHARAAELEEAALALGEDPAWRVTAARYRLALGQDGAAAAHLARAPVSAPALALRGVLAARAGRCAEAMRLLDAALELDPDEPDARVNRAKMGGCRER